jgi:hypothetical protein
MKILTQLDGKLEETGKEVFMTRMCAQFEF